MERLIFTDRKTSDSKLTVIQECFIAFLVSLGTFFCMNDLFGFSYALRNGFSGGITGGLVKTWNMIAEALGGSDFILLTRYAGESENNGLFLTLCIVLGALCAFVIIRQRNIWALLIFALPVALINLLTELGISQISSAVLILSLLFAVIFIKSDGQGFVYEFLLIVLMGIVIYSAFQMPGISSFAGKPVPVRNIQQQTEAFIGKLYYGENPLKSGDLTERTRGEKEGTALVITMENPQSVYLRGFTGDIYTGDSWVPLADQAYYDVNDQMIWHEKNGFNALGQIGQAKKLSGEKTKSATINIKAEGADKRYAYIPYEIESFEGDERPDIKGGNFGEAKGLKKLKEYTCIAGENATKDWTETAARIFTEAEEQQEKELENYFIEESNYNTYVYSDFTYLSGSDKQRIKKEIGESGDQSKGHIDYKYAIRKITEYLDENFIYTENLGNRPTEEPQMLSEFFEKKKGYDVQYATAATLMFRYYGIPARYVEGYLVTPEDAEKAEKGKPFEIGFERAHAWTEIYIDGAGFVPVEVTPEYKGVMEEADMKIGISNNTLLREFDEPETEKNNQGESSSGGDDDKPEGWKWFILVAVTVLVFAVIVVSLLIKLIAALLLIEKRRKLFRKGEAKTAVSAIYGYMEEKDYPVTQYVRTLGNKAAYSMSNITEDERKYMLGQLKKAKKAASEEKKQMRKKKRKKVKRLNKGMQ